MHEERHEPRSRLKREVRYEPASHGASHLAMDKVFGEKMDKLPKGEIANMSTDSRPQTKRITSLRLLVPLVILFSLILNLSLPAATEAAGIELGVTAQKAWNDVLNKADRQTKTSLQRGYENVGSLKGQGETWEKKTKALHTSNMTELKRLQASIRQTDEKKISSLTHSLKRAQARYEPLFALYTAVNKQLDAARATKNKEWTAVVRAQADTLKPAVQLAREEIRLKKNELAEARKRKNTEIKRLRSMLSGADSVKRQIQTAKKQVSLTKERYSNALKQFKQSLKQTQPSRVLSSLNQLVSATEKWTSTKQHVYTLEQKVSNHYTKVNQELAKRK
ncbi:hypothetical protein [Paenibacillus tundrae]|uniref:ElaB/YqjD/DUF883 family membrane-anchored ribosome-binding protein n=1 Tax=Paenibacillus tundrae TaxID=528187 RepID=A0ABT9WEQ9_9BACL|nr:hypothetical protein [Paenibacillus tundrae]MDQ0171719.1 ElaB/YqjD/DUF883 family membrane-anchored ribosome-binding protein [Paenibacillus tundrae]